MEPGRFLSYLDPVARDWLLKNAPIRTLLPGEYLIHLGERAGHGGGEMYIVKSGRLKVEIVSVGEGEHGVERTAIQRIAGPEDIVGELSLIIDEWNRNASVVAIEPVEVHVVTRRKFDELLAKWPLPTTQALMLDLAHRLAGLSKQASALQFLPVAARVCHQLRMLHEGYGGGWIPVTQVQLAQMVGSTRQSVNNTLKELQNDEAIECGFKRIKVINASLLSERSQI